MITKHVFEVKIAGDCELLAVDPFVQHLNNIGEIVFFSHTFSDFPLCASKLSEMLGTIAIFLEQITEHRYVLVSSVNPAYAIGSGSETDEKWDPLTIAKYQLCNIDHLKKESTGIISTVSAKILVATEDLILTKTLESPQLQ